MQTAVTLAIGTAGIAIPSSIGGRGFAATSLVKVVLRVPALDAGTHTVATSEDGGTTWDISSGPIALTGMEQVNPTAATSTGGWRAIYGPYFPGTMFRLTSSVSQTATATVRFGI